MSENRAGPRTPEPAQHNLQDHQSLDFLVILGNRSKDAPKTLKRPIPVTLVREEHSPSQTKRRWKTNRTTLLGRHRVAMMVFKPTLRKNRTSHSEVVGGGFKRSICFASWHLLPVHGELNIQPDLALTGELGGNMETTSRILDIVTGVSNQKLPRRSHHFPDTLLNPPFTGEGDQIVFIAHRAARLRVPQLRDNCAKVLVEWRLVASDRLSKWSSQPGRHNLEMPPDHRLMAITILLPVSSEDLESPPPTEISMKPDNGKRRLRDDVDPGDPRSAHMGSCLAWKCWSNTTQAVQSTGMFANLRWLRIMEEDVGGETHDIVGRGPKKEWQTSDFSHLTEPTLFSMHTMGPLHRHESLGSAFRLTSGLRLTTPRSNSPLAGSPPQHMSHAPPMTLHPTRIGAMIHEAHLAMCEMVVWRHKPSRDPLTRRGKPLTHNPTSQCPSFDLELSRHPFSLILPSNGRVVAVEGISGVIGVVQGV
ncbi:hypothetical protein F5882DRAFT_379933 [Hyaloscypha sp. PMI_1271]|nr:hypothetical protein F5882DRAFT_379933 [Hyaloscypha sp. PMI_1271]